MSLHIYGLVIALAILLGYGTARFRLKQSLLDLADLDSLLFWTVVFGIIGARFYHVVDYWRFYAAHPVQIVKLWEGGLGIFGAIAGGVMGAYFWWQRNYYHYIYNDSKKNFMALLDFLMPSLAIGQAVGRFGNWVNLEGFGPPCQLLWCVFIPIEKRPLMWAGFERFHPTFFYESFWMSLGFGLLLIMESKLIEYKVRNNSRGWIGRLARPGTLTAFYFLWYGAGRFVLEFYRFDTWEINHIKVAQVISLGLVLASLSYFIYCLYFKEKTLKRTKGVSFF